VVTEDGDLISAAEPDDHEDVHEEVDDVQVDVQGSKDVFLRAEAVLVLSPHHQLGVIDDVEREDEGASAAKANHHPLGLGEEHEDDAGDHEDDEQGAKHSSAGSEVNLGLESKDGEGEGDTSSDTHSDENSINVIEG